MLYAFLLLIMSVPIGYLLRSITKEELKAGKKYFRLFWIISLIVAFGMLFVDFNDYTLKLSIIFTLLFMANVAFISWK